MSNTNELLIIGQPYPNAIPVQQGAIAEFLRPHGNRLFVSLPNVTSDEIEALSDGELTVKLHKDKYSKGLLLVFCFKKDQFELNFDCPYQAAIVPDLVLPNVTSSKNRLAFEIVVVDPAANNQIINLRFITMSPELTLEFLMHVQLQLSAPHSVQDADHWIDLQRLLFTANELAALPIESFQCGKP
ncbi:hypothetical protein VA249_45920 (plasmid) [Vibrio alfacsensis]|uniref:hypothetical protein n=1 Tax=Vibrio alfacsensis TaxID=1074311 RepID=UPI001BEF7C6D|nr:hypothetical protein [Vibrio alfacsensis]BBM67946.1 hypothetical protein VA249_45920 [Vibrio alfacsensis]